MPSHPGNSAGRHGGFLILPIPPTINFLGLLGGGLQIFNSMNWSFVFGFFAVKSRCTLRSEPGRRSCNKDISGVLVSTLHIGSRAVYHGSHLIELDLGIDLDLPCVPSWLILRSWHSGSW